MYSISCRGTASHHHFSPAWTTMVTAVVIGLLVLDDIQTTLPVGSSVEAALVDVDVEAAIHPEKIVAADQLYLAQNFSGIVTARKGPPGPEKTSMKNVVYQNQFGYADWTFEKPMSHDAHFPVASNTKVYTAVALYQLQERGLVNLSHDIGNYLNATDFRKFGLPEDSVFCPKIVGAENATECQVITFINLLDMSSGIANLLHGFEPFLGSIAPVVGGFLLKPILFTPGTQYYYSNPSFELAGYFVEKFSGMEFGDYLKQHIWDVVGLEDTYFRPYNEEFHIDARRVNEFRRFIDPSNISEQVSMGKCTSEFQLGWLGAAGGLVSTQHDEALWYYTLFNTSQGDQIGAPLLTSASLYAIVKPRTKIPHARYKDVYYAQGLFVHASDMTTNLPDQITYEGMIMCSWTSNVYDLRYTPPAMAQSWTNTPVYYATAAAVTSASRSWGKGSILDLLSVFPQAKGAQTLSHELINIFF